MMSGSSDERFRSALMLSAMRSNPCRVPGESAAHQTNHLKRFFDQVSMDVALELWPEQGQHVGFGGPHARREIQAGRAHELGHQVTHEHAVHLEQGPEDGVRAERRHGVALDRLFRAIGSGG